MSKIYTIKEFGRMFSLSASALRYYEEVGILTNVGRNPSGQRQYDDRHVHRMNTFLCFKGTGMSIARLQEFFGYEANEQEHAAEIAALLQMRKEEIQQQLKLLLDTAVHVNRKLQYYMDMKCAVEEGKLPPVWEDYRETDD